jgi:signal transduction histidine kinase
MRLTSRLTLSHLAVLLLGMGLAAALSWVTVEHMYVDGQRENLLSQARLTASALAGEPLPSGASEPYSQTANLEPGIHTRLLSQSGAVLVGLPGGAGTLEVQLPGPESGVAMSPAELMLRPEIRSAASGKAATAIRRVAMAENRRVLYAAAPVPDAEGKPAAIVYIAMPLPRSGLPASVWLRLAGALLAATGIAALAGSTLARQLARPLARLAGAADAVRSGHFDVPLEASGVAEVRRLGEAFRSMTLRLRRSEQAKDAFLADVTHELRTPLTVIKGTIETLEDGALEDLDARGGMLASMGAETERLIRLVNELLVLTRLDAGALALTFQDFDLTTLVRARCDAFEALAARRGIGLRVVRAEAMPADACSVRGDPDRVAQVIDNLLDNALRHAPDRTEITCLITRRADAVQCAVRDQGRGIPPAHLPMIFERFYRVDAARDRAAGGAGLGLSIVRALVTAQGGEVSAESRLGSGATIAFTLPASDPASDLAHP